MKMIMTRAEFNNLKTRVDEFGFPLVAFTLNENLEKGYEYNKAIIKRTIFGCKRIGSNSIPIEIKEK